MSSAAELAGLTLGMISAILYRYSFSTIGRVERMEEDVEEAERFHEELEHVHLPKLPKDCEGIDRDQVDDRKAEIAR